MKLLIIDSNALVHRAYHALPPLTTKKKELVNAVYGYLSVFFKVFNEIKPEYVAAAFDFPAPSFRSKEFKEYKAKRVRAPDELYNQIPIVKEILEKFEVPIFEKQGLEADDLIATIVKVAQKRQVLPKLEIYVLTGDLDALQLISENVKVYALGKGIKETIVYDKEKVKEKFGISPDQVVDFKALAGDPSDNIPGATGIGKKTAVELLQEYGSIDNLYKAIEKGEAWDLKERTKKLLTDYKEQVDLSFSLAKARDDAAIDFSLEKCRWKGYNKEKARAVIEKYEFYTLLNRLEK